MHIYQFFGVDKTKEKRKVSQGWIIFPQQIIKLEVENAEKLKVNYPWIKRTKALIL